MEGGTAVKAEVEEVSSSDSESEETLKKEEAEETPEGNDSLKENDAGKEQEEGAAEEEEEDYRTPIGERFGSFVCASGGDVRRTAGESRCVVRQGK